MKESLTGIFLVMRSFGRLMPLPVGEREVRGILPVSTLDDMSNYVDLLSRGILEILSLYRKLVLTHSICPFFLTRKERIMGFTPFVP